MAEQLRYYEYFIYPCKFLSSFYTFHVHIFYIKQIVWINKNKI